MDPPQDLTVKRERSGGGRAGAGRDRAGRPSVLSDDQRSATTTATIHAGKARASAATRFRVHTRTTRRVVDDSMAETNVR